MSTEQSVIRFAIANVSAVTAAMRAKDYGVSATIHDALGAGEWGVEPTCVIESAVGDSGAVLRLIDYVRALAVQEECVYGVANGANPFLLWPAMVYRQVGVDPAPSRELLSSPAVWVAGPAGLIRPGRAVRIVLPSGANVYLTCL
jgi:hypothetical protein